MAQGSDYPQWAEKGGGKDAHKGSHKGAYKGADKGGYKGDQGKGGKARAPIELDPLSPCGHFLTGQCWYGNACCMSHDAAYARSVRAQWLQPLDKAAQKELRESAERAGLAFEARILALPVGAGRGTRPHWRSESGDGTAELQVHCPFKVLVVLDLEGKPDTGGITELPALLLDTATQQEIGRFQKWVRIAGESSAPIATDFWTVLDQFCKWLKGHGLDVTEPGEDFAIVTCGDWDLRKALPGQCRLLGGSDQDLPAAFHAWINMKVIFNQHHGTNITGMKGALARMRLLDAQGLPKHGCHHLGMHDVENIARVMVHLLQEGAEVDTTAPRSGARPGRWKGAFDEDASRGSKSPSTGQRAHGAIAGRGKGAEGGGVLP